jgi:heat shock protein HtpX
VNILTGVLTAAFFIIPAVLIGWGTVLFLGSIVLLGSGLMFRSSIDPERIAGVRRLSPYYHGTLQRINASLAERAELESIPELYVSEQNIANAAAVETSRGPAIIVTQRLLDSLSYDELEAVLAHEIHHIKHGDIRLLTLLSQFRALYSMVPKMILGLLFFAPLLLFFMPLTQGLMVMGISAVTAVIIERAIMRLREYAADYGAAQVIDDPLSLARALQRLESTPVYINWMGRPVAVPRQRLEDRGGLSDLFRSHPRTESRIGFLKNIASRRHRDQGVFWSTVE